MRCTPTALAMSDVRRWRVVILVDMGFYQPPVSPILGGGLKLGDTPRPPAGCILHLSHYLGLAFIREMARYMPTYDRSSVGR